MKIPGVVKLAGALPPSISILRIVDIAGIDVADDGTHVRNLSEVGRIRNNPAGEQGHGKP